MPVYTYDVTQQVRYYDGVEYDRPENVLEMVESGDWDVSNNSVLADRVQVIDENLEVVLDTGSNKVQVWSATVVTPDSRYIATSVHPTEKDAQDAMRENHDPEGECKEMTIEEMAAYFSFELTIQPHDVVLQHPMLVLP